MYKEKLCMHNEKGKLSSSGPLPISFCHYFVSVLSRDPRFREIACCAYKSHFSLHIPRSVQMRCWSSAQATLDAASDPDPIALLVIWK